MNLIYSTCGGLVDRRDIRDAFMRIFFQHVLLHSFFFFLISSLIMNRMDDSPFLLAGLWYDGMGEFKASVIVSSGIEFR